MKALRSLLDDWRARESAEGQARMEQAAFEELKASIREMMEIEAGRRTPAREARFVDLDVAEIRADTGLTQEEFATVLGISTRTLQEWEQGRRRPRGPARSLLLVARHDPQAVIEGVRAELERRV